MSEAIQVFATLHPAPGHEDEVLESLRLMVADTRAEPGNEVYELYASKEGGRTTFHLFERYRDQFALQAHRESSHYRDYRAKVGDLVSDPIRAVILTAIDTAADVSSPKPDGSTL